MVEEFVVSILNDVERDFHWIEKIVMVEVNERLEEDFEHVHDDELPEFLLYTREQNLTESIVLFILLFFLVYDLEKHIPRFAHLSVLNLLDKHIQ